MSENVKRIPKRSDVDDKFKWSLDKFFDSDDKWQEEYDELNVRICDIEKFKGTLGESQEKLAECLALDRDLSINLEKIYCYAHLRLHEDTANTFYQGLSRKADNLSIKYSSIASFIVPEITSLPDDLLMQYKSSECLAEYAHFFDNILREKEHILSEREEEILAQTGKLSEASGNIFEMINECDIKFPHIHDEKGNEVELTKGRYITFLKNKNRNVRKEAFEALYKTYNNQINTLAATYSASVKSDIFYAEMRKYNSALEMSVSDDNIPKEVYTNLIATVHEHLHLLHRYVKLRKKILGLDELHMYDLYVPIVPDFDMKITYDEAVELAKLSLKPLGEKYMDALNHGLSSAWIDVYENKGKRGGAYSWGAFATHPCVLLNHEDNIDSAFTLVHEMGHALHSYFTWAKQPYIYSGHKIFVAEVASTVNEALLMEHMLKNANGIEEKKYLLNYFMEQFRGTLYRQVMFAEFEMITHEMMENDEPLTPDILNKIYRELNEKYYGPDIIIDDDIAIEWARIPHFYNSFYVFQYATGYSAAIALSRQILENGKESVDKYIDFLSSGDSDYSINLLKAAGVNMATPEPIKKALAVFKDILDEMEQLY